MSVPLRVLRGKVENLSVHAGEEEFIRSQAQRTVGGAAAVGLAIGGLAGPAVGGAIAATGADSVEFFTCTVNGEPVGGRFSKVTFKEGDEVEVVVEGTDSVLAVRRPADKMLWMFPHCSRGKTAHRNFIMGAFWWMFFGALIVTMGSYLLLGVWWHPGMSSAETLASPDAVRFAFAISAVLSFILAIYFSVRFFSQWKPLVDRTEEILGTLGYPNPSRVDLEKDNKRAAKARGEKWPYLTGGPWIYRYPEDR